MVLNKEQIEKRIDKLPESVYDAIADKNYDLGVCSGMRDSADILLEKAACCFKRLQDEKAKTLRDLSRELREKEAKIRKKYDEDYPKLT